MRIGDKVRFIPSAFCPETAKYTAKKQKDPPPRYVTGKIININRAHRHYTARYTVFGYTLTETFKF